MERDRRHCIRAIWITMPRFSHQSRYLADIVSLLGQIQYVASEATAYFGMNHSNEQSRVAIAALPRHLV